jgi:hypothetical protein
LTGKSLNRSLFLALTISLLGLALCFGNVSIDQKVTLWGTSLSISFSTVLVGRSWLIAITLTQRPAFASHEQNPA